MRASIYILSALCLLLLFVSIVNAESEQSLSLEDEFASLEQEIDQENGASLVELDSTKRRRKNSGGGGVQRGGKERKTGLDLSKGTVDGSVLPPWDPFRIHKRQSRFLKWKQTKRQRQVDKETQLEHCRAKRARRRRREALERKELREERRRIREEKRRKALLAKKGGDGSYETDLMELNSSLSSTAELDASLASEIQSDEMAIVDDEAEANADAAEAEADSIEQEEEILAEDDQELEDELDIDSDADSDSGAEEDVLLESESTDEALRRHRLKPTKGVSYNLDGSESFSNDGGRAVFARRANTMEKVFFEKQHFSDGGRAVVNGVTKAPCGKEVTDKGLFAAEISDNLKNTVPAANFKPNWIDDPSHAVQKLPVYPAIRVKGEVDEYGDPVE